MTVLIGIKIRQFTTKARNRRREVTARLHEGKTRVFKVCVESSRSSANSNAFQAFLEKSLCVLCVLWVLCASLCLNLAGMGRRDDRPHFLVRGFSLAVEHLQQGKTSSRFPNG
jgi:hypothetical protein